MPTKSRAKTEPDDEFPIMRACAADEVHERLLRTVPGYAETRSAIEDRTMRILGFAGGAALRTGCTEIPVVVHVVHRNATEDISDAQVQSQIAVLNEDYRATNADRSSTPAVFQPLIADARVTFKLATVDPAGDPTTGITRHSSTNASFNSDTDNVKHDSTGGADAWPADRYLNIWTCGNLRDTAGHALLGYAQFPGGPADTDGVVILQSAFGNTGTATAPFALGRTATHEIGHWLNLRHIWGDDGTGCSGSDFVADTPNAGGPNFGSPTFPNISCSNGPNGDLFMNYMDYVDDAAMFMFTTGQVDRMQAALDGPRSSIGVSGPCGGKPIKELVKDTVKDAPKEGFKENPKDFVKELPKDSPKDFVKEPIKEQPKELIKDFVKEHAFDVPKQLLDPQKGFSADLPFPDPGPIFESGFGQFGQFGQGATPFVLGGRKDPCEGCGPAAGTVGGASADPLLAVVQQLGGVLAAYYAAASRGQLDTQGSARRQQLATIYAQIVSMLG